MFFYFIFSKRGTDIYIYTDRKEEKGKEESNALEKKSKTELKYLFCELILFYILLFEFCDRHLYQFYRVVKEN